MNVDKIVYLPYRPLRDRFWSTISHTVPKKQRRMEKTSVMREVIGQCLSVPGATSTLEANALVDEESYFEEGCPMFFPESPALLEMLWRSKMQLKLNDLDMTRIPVSFSIAWPRCEIAKAQMEGCLVSIQDGHQHSALLGKFGMKYFGYPLSVDPSSVRFSEDEMSLRITYFGQKGGALGVPLLRCCIPSSVLERTLGDESAYDGFMRESDLKDVMLGVLDLDKEEEHQQFVMARLVLCLLIYMQACPEHVRNGLPDGRKEREFCSPYSDIDWKIIGAPSGLKGKHASPSSHWRTWHFRSYPLRKDGTKKKGAVYVNATMVNAEVDPVTVDNDIQRDRTQAHSQGIVVGH